MTPTPPNLTEEQKNRLAQRLSMMSHDRADVGQGLPRTVRALALGQGSDAGASRLEALVDALVFERVIVPIDVEPDPRVTGVHAGENGHNPIDFVRAQTPAGEALAIYSSAQALSAHRPGDRPMALDFRTIGLTALVETGGRIVVNPGTDAVLLPRPAVAALAQGDEWLPACVRGPRVFCSGGRCLGDERNAVGRPECRGRQPAPYRLGRSSRDRARPALNRHRGLPAQREARNDC